MEARPLLEPLQRSLMHAAQRWQRCDCLCIRCVCAELLLKELCRRGCRLPSPLFIDPHSMPQPPPSSLPPVLRARGRTHPSSAVDGARWRGAPRSFTDLFHLRLRSDVFDFIQRHSLFDAVADKVCLPLEGCPRKTSPSPPPLWFRGIVWGAGRRETGSNGPQSPHRQTGCRMVKKEVCCRQVYTVENGTCHGQPTHPKWYRN